MPAPGHVDGPAEVELAVEQDAGDSGEAVIITQQLVFLEPGPVREVVRHDAGEL
ncbi:hypothetical protein [Cryobacterium sp. Sr3]|uniref:hypothetical protein n=1 Tax=Cryobacterium sp. Sr3 TaxID=1259194 RepID=UPI00141BEEFF|nr:hypothetical protein [Cryobacterium sp. Sr3]